ncbi:hypothetical protein LTR24_000767 [Lithohypha guttulata]|uniref:Transmembrane protein n=1 Tax=Lithohypha guttulata TaxID=1690604 RepID=A0ABR0KMW3_9EURO|nr:hypothetical protein LTR24_000767 [Lithohypha guttulata]
MSQSAHQLETSIKTLQNDATKRASLETSSSPSDSDVENALDTLASVLIPILHILQGTPVRAIVVTVVGLWSLLAITYLFFAQRSKKHPNTNKRSLRVTLELTTLVLWIISIVCSAMLALQYGIMALTGGVEAKVAFSLCRELIKAALEEVAEGAASGNIMRALEIVGQLVTIGGVSIVSVGVSAVCAAVSFVSLVVACCVSGGKKGSGGGYSSVRPRSEVTETLTMDDSAEKTPVSYVSEVQSPWQTPVTPATPYRYSDRGFSGRQMV